MEIKHIVGLLVLVAVMFFGTVFMFVYKTSSPRPLTNSTNSSQTSNTQTSTSSSSQSNQSSGQNISTDISVPDASAPYESECVIQKKAAAAGKNYEKGSILVTFEDAMDFGTAIKTVELLRKELGVQVVESSDVQRNFEQYHWLEAIVPQSSEFSSQCELEKSEGVKRTSLNFLFSLRQ
jgi:hypothetical protein